MSDKTVYIEAGSKRVFAGAIDWPGWARSARDEASALAALLLYAPRYDRAMAAGGLQLARPTNVSALVVIERLAGNAGTDFGAPVVTPASDARPLDEHECERLQAILKACWQEFDRIVGTAGGRELHKGPRGGGRTLDEIVGHVLEADMAYLAQLGRKATLGVGERSIQGIREAMLAALIALAPVEKPGVGPRGGNRWWPRYFVRRVAWHCLDHAWEIEDRLE